MIYRNVSSKEIIRKVLRDLRPSTTDWILDAVEWMGEALEHIGASSQLCQKVCAIPVTGHKGHLPKDLYYINQVAVNTCQGPTIQSNVSEISAQITQLNDSLAAYYTQVNQTVNLNADGTYQSNLTTEDLNEFDSWHHSTLTQLRELNSRMHILEVQMFADQRCLQPLGYGTGTFHESLQCEDCAPVQSSKLTYIINCGSLQTSFSEGVVCLSYTAFPTDEECWPMVPDDISFREAMFWYIHKKLIMSGVQLQSKFSYESAEQYWWKYCTQARNAANYPDIPKMDSFMDQWVRLVPNMDRSMTFFENLNNREQLQREQY